MSKNPGIEIILTVLGIALNLALLLATFVLGLAILVWLIRAIV